MNMEGFLKRKGGACSGPRGPKKNTNRFLGFSNKAPGWGAERFFQITTAFCRGKKNMWPGQRILVPAPKGFGFIGPAFPEKKKNNLAFFWGRNPLAGPKKKKKKKAVLKKKKIFNGELSDFGSRPDGGSKNTPFFRGTGSFCLSRALQNTGPGGGGKTQKKPNNLKPAHPPGVLGPGDGKNSCKKKQGGGFQIASRDLGFSEKTAKDGFGFLLKSKGHNPGPNFIGRLFGGEKPGGAGGFAGGPQLGPPQGHPQRSEVGGGPQAKKKGGGGGV